VNLNLEDNIPNRGLRFSTKIKSISSDLDFWQKLVTKYTRASLTRESDRLVAIAGVGKHLQSLTNDDYLAGLWRRDIEKQLLWEVSESDDHKPIIGFSHHRPINFKPQTSYRPRNYRAPSWSWASVEGGVEWLWGISKRAEMLVEVTDVRLIPSGPDEFSQIQDCVLYIRSKMPLKTARIYQDRDETNGIYRWSLGFEEKGEIKPTYLY
jgi:hypothetical protein